MVRALFFDAAGTLFEPAEPVAATYSRILARFGHRLDATRIASVFGGVFRNAGIPDYHAHPTGDLAERAWWHELVTTVLDRCDEPALGGEAFEALFDHYAHGHAWRLFPETRTVLSQAQDLGLRLAVVSNFDLRLHRILADFDLIEPFEFVLTSAEAAARKPDPAIFQHALGRMGVPAEEVMHVGDTPLADLHGARAARIPAFLVDRPDQDLSHFLDRVRDQRGN